MAAFWHYSHIPWFGIQCWKTIHSNFVSTVVTNLNYLEKTEIKKKEEEENKSIKETETEEKQEREKKRQI